MDPETQILCRDCNVEEAKFNYKDSLSPTHCRTCAKPSMIKISGFRRARCLKCSHLMTKVGSTICDDCIQIKINGEYYCVECNDKLANFNYPDRTKPVRCGDCCLVGMVCLRKRKRGNTELPSNKRVKVDITPSNNKIISSDDGDMLITPDGYRLGINAGGEIGIMSCHGVLMFKMNIYKPPTYDKMSTIPPFLYIPPIKE